MIGRSLWVEGTYELQTDVDRPLHRVYRILQWAPRFLIDPMVEDRLSPMGEVPLGSRVVRSPLLFEDIDPTDLTPEQLGDALLWNLVDHTQVQLISQ